MIGDHSKIVRAGKWCVLFLVMMTAISMVYVSDFFIKTDTFKHIISTSQFRILNTTHQTTRNPFHESSVIPQNTTHQVVTLSAKNRLVVTPTIMLTSGSRALPLRSCDEKRHVAFVKVHKAGSTTVTNIIQRFGISRKATFILPKSAIYIGKYSSILKTKILSPPIGKRYELLCNHVIYNRDVFARFLPKDTVKIAILREPFSQMKSAFIYYRDVWKLPWYVHIEGPGAVSKFVLRQKTLEPPSAFASYTNNRMSIDMGVPQKKLNDTNFVRDYLRELDRDFGLVMIMEYFDESMILLRRLLCWRTKDVLYIKRNSGESSDSMESAAVRAVHKNFSKADYLLYEHFLGSFLEKVRHLGKDFADEVASFKSYNIKLKHFCEGAAIGRKLYFDSTKWSASFSVDHKDCSLLLKDETDMNSLIKAIQYPITPRPKIK